MRMDSDGGFPQSPNVSLAREIESALRAAGMRQRDLAEAIGVSEGQMSKMIKLGSGLTFSSVAAIEEALELPRGAILRGAGYVEPLSDEITTEQAIRADGGLDVDGKEQLIGSYRVALRASRPQSPSMRQPRRPRRS